MIVYVKTDNGGTLNLRSAPNAGVIAQINNNAELEAPDGLSNEWTKVVYNNTTGYVMTKFLVTSKKEITKDEIQKIRDSLYKTLQVIEEVLK